MVNEVFKHFELFAVVYLTSCIVDKINVSWDTKGSGLWVCQPVHDSRRTGTTEVAKCNCEDTDLNCVSVSS